MAYGSRCNSVGYLLFHVKVCSGLYERSPELVIRDGKIANVILSVRTRSLLTNDVIKELLLSHMTEDWICQSSLKTQRNWSEVVELPSYRFII